MHSILLLLLLALAVPSYAVATVTHLVTFGDSYTDQSRLQYFSQNGSYPPPHYQEVYPPLQFAADGGATWVRYAEMYGNLTAYNYAVSGAACSNLLTARPGSGPPSYPDANYPSVKEYEIGAFVEDWVQNTSTGYFNMLDPRTTVYSLWIGTNDVGDGSLLTGNQTAGVTIVNVTECAIDWMKTMYTYGARRFILQNMIPLQLVPMYAIAPDTGGLDWQTPHNRTSYNIQLQELVMAGNALWDLQVPAALTTLPGASAAVFSSYSLFMDMYTTPQDFLNGTLPLNVTGYVSHGSGANVTNATNPDSYLWWNELHPSEQAQRNNAKQIVATLSRQSKYATYYGRW